MPSDTATSSDVADSPTRRKRLLENRQTRLDVKRTRFSSLEAELSSLTYDEDAPIRSPFSRGSRTGLRNPSPTKAPSPTKTAATPKSASSARTQATSSGPVVVSLPTVTTRKTRVASAGTEEAVTGRQEATVLSRVAHLQKEGLWVDKKLTKFTEPPGSVKKSHWDYVLEEMSWMSTVYTQEVKTKKFNSRKCAKMVQKHFSDKVAAVKRAEKEHQQNIRRIASFAAKEIRGFWGNVEKVFEFRLKTQIEAKRKRALDQHLNKIVEKTEKYSNLLTESMAKGGGSNRTTPTPSVSGDGGSSKGGGDEEEDEYNPNVEDSDDDERTIAKEEDQHEDGEVDALKDEGEMPIEELLKMYGYVANPDQAQGTTSGGGKEKDKTPSVTSSTDGSSSVVAKTSRGSRAERLKRRAAAKVDEGNNGLASVAENGDKESPTTTPAGGAQVESKEDTLLPEDDVDEEALEKAMAGSDEEATDADDQDADEDEEDEDDEDGADTAEDNESDEGGEDKDETKLLVSQSGGKEGEDENFQDMIEMAATFQPTGNTLDTTSVKTKVPFLLKYTLREYQHIGLDWLVSMYERNLNGILADEMGLGKTIQTVAFLAHLATDREMWGPHLIVVPTSVMLNWEMELKKWCPAFKVLTYYGSQKERRLKRVGWTKPNSFHVCITSYKLVIQDHTSFRRKQWHYLILDEAQHIKNFKSQRWQLLLNFASEGRLLLTGTPLQNNLMELWSLMHFLMPNVFESHRDFKEWFSNPLTGMVEGSAEYNDGLIKRLHKVLRPFLLRRLKSEVEQQMPKKYEHVVRCPLSKRQRFLYDDFMSRANTKDTLKSGNLLSVINVLMQLRKVCNHPNLFEPRPTVSPFVGQPADPSLHQVLHRHLADDLSPVENLNLTYHPLVLANHENMTGYGAFKANRLRAPKVPLQDYLVKGRTFVPVKCPKGRLRLVLKTTPVTGGQLNPGIPQEFPRPLGERIPMSTVLSSNLWQRRKLETVIRTGQGAYVLSRQLRQVLQLRHDVVSPPIENGDSKNCEEHESDQGFADYYSSDCFTRNSLKANGKCSDHHPTHRKAKISDHPQKQSDNKSDTESDSSDSDSSDSSDSSDDEDRVTPSGIFSSKKFFKNPEMSKTCSVPEPGFESRQREHVASSSSRVCQTNEIKCKTCPLYGSDLVHDTLSFDTTRVRPLTVSGVSRSSCGDSSKTGSVDLTMYDLGNLCQTQADVIERFVPFSTKFLLYVPSCVSAVSSTITQRPAVLKLEEGFREAAATAAQANQKTEDVISGGCRVEVPSLTRMTERVSNSLLLQLPEARLIQYDCGKLQVMARLLRQLKDEGHRVLIFTQMTKVLDVLEAFLSFHGFIYLRLDGSTRVEQRQLLMERFNNNTKYFAFILSTRSGGVGINLTGADTVIFYDSDWNPTMDAQAQDRCHRIGQTRDVHIYRMVSERTVEENILKKANQKRMLGDLAIEGGNFTTAFFKKQTISDLFEVDENTLQSVKDAKEAAAGGRVITTEITEIEPGKEDGEDSSKSTKANKKALGAFESAIAAAEDDADIKAMKQAHAEVQEENREFDEDALEEDEGIGNLLKQLSSVERYALNLMEWSEREWRAEQLRAADAELEAASAGVDATDKLEEMAEEVIRQDRNKSPVEEAPPPPKKGSGKKRVSEVPAATAAAVASGSTTPGRSTRSREPDVSIDLWKLGKSPPRF